MELLQSPVPGAGEPPELYGMSESLQEGGLGWVALELSCASARMEKDVCQFPPDPALGQETQEEQQKVV